MSEGAAEGKYIGHTDVPATKEGIAQLHDIIDNYGSYPEADAVFTSPLLRCTQTAKELYPDRNPIVLDDLIEYDFGEFEGRTAEELKDDEDFVEWLAGTNPNKAAPFGDSQVRFNYRVCSCFEKIVDSVIKAGVGSTAVITHGGVIMSIMAAYALPEAPMHEWLTPNGCGYTLRITPFIWYRGMKAEAIAECPALPLTEEQERELWDVYDPDNDELDVEYWENDKNFPEEQ